MVATYNAAVIVITYRPLVRHIGTLAGRLSMFLACAAELLLQHNTLISPPAQPGTSSGSGSSVAAAAAPAAAQQRSGSDASAPAAGVAAGGRQREAVQHQHQQYKPQPPWPPGKLDTSVLKDLVCEAALGTYAVQLLRLLWKE